MEVLGKVILQNSLAGSILIVLILLFRKITEKFPKLYVHILWILLSLVLLIPPVPGNPLPTARNRIAESASAAVQEGGSGQNGVVEPENAVGQEGPGENALGREDLLTQPAAEKADQAASVLTAGGAAVKGREKEPLDAGPFGSSGNKAILFTGIWALGAVICAAAGLVQWIRLKRRTVAAVRVEQNVWRTEYIQAPFVMPGFPSRIYIPYGLEGEQLEDILAHERMHIRHGDPWIKCMGAAALILHWFNPLVWLAFCLMGRDMEMFCDECVLRGKSFAEKKQYSQTLLDFARDKRGFAPAVYFGESSVKSRIYHILYSKKPRLLVSLLLVVFIGGCGVSFMTTGEEISGSDRENDLEADKVPISDPVAENPAESPEEAERAGEEDWTKQAIVGIGHPGMTKEFDTEELSLMGETAGFACYSMDGGEHFLVTAPDGCMIYADAPVISNYEIQPLLNEADYDGDGENELAVITCVLHGTGVKVDSLFMADHTEDRSWKIYQFLDSDYLGWFAPYFDTVYEEDGVRLLFDGVRAGMEEYEGGPVGVTEKVGQEYLDNHYAYYAGSQIDFRFVEGTIWLRAELGGYSDIHLAGNFPGHGLETAVSYLGEGRWELASDVRYLDVRINTCIEEGLSLYFTGQNEEFREYYAARDFRPDAFDRVCREVTILSLTYSWDNMDSGRVEAYAEVRLDDEDSLHYVTLSMQGTRLSNVEMDWKIANMWIEK